MNLPTHYRSINLTPILYQSAYGPSPIHQYNANSGPICQSITNLQIHHQSVNPSPIQEFDANLGQICKSITDPPIHHQSANPSPIRQSNSNSGPIWESIPTSQSCNNAGPMRCQSCIPSSIRRSCANPLPIQFQSITNPISLNYRSPHLMSLLDQSANPPPICQSHANPMTIYQSSTDFEI